MNDLDKRARGLELLLRLGKGSREEFFGEKMIYVSSRCSDNYSNRSAETPLSVSVQAD